MQLRRGQRAASHRRNGIENRKDIIGSGRSFMESADHFRERSYRLHELDQGDQEEKECTAIESLGKYFLAAKPENGNESGDGQCLVERIDQLPDAGQAS